MTHPVIDAHQHVWDRAKAEYAWLGDAHGPINRDIGFDELAPKLRETGVQATVLVQSADNADDTALMVETAAAHHQVVGVVGWVPLDRPQQAADILDTWADDDLMVGVRNLIHDMPDPDWLLRPDVDEGLGLLEARGVPFDLVAVLPRHLELVPILSERHPDLRIVIDHLAKPPIGLESSEPWRSLMAAAAANPRVYGKVSGLYSATDDLAAWTTDAVRPFFDTAMELFGADHLMYGGDWPVSILAGDYVRVWNGLRPLFAGLSETERESVLGRTAAAFYGLSTRRLAAAAE